MEVIKASAEFKAEADDGSTMAYNLGFDAYKAQVTLLFPEVDMGGFNLEASNNEAKEEEDQASPTSATESKVILDPIAKPTFDPTTKLASREPL